MFAEDPAILPVLSAPSTEAHLVASLLVAASLQAPNVEIHVGCVPIEFCCTKMVPEEYTADLFHAISVMTLDSILTWS